jgi:hypothetical protein
MRIFKVSQNDRISLDDKGARIQRLNSQRSAVLAEIRTMDSNAGDNARIALIQYLDRLSDRKIRAQL